MPSTPTTSRVSSATTPPSSTLALMIHAAVPAPPAVSSEPSLRPSTLLRMPPITGTATKKNISSSCQEPSSGPLDTRGSGSGRPSPLMRAINASTPAFSPPAKSPTLKSGAMARSMMMRAARSGTAPSSALATSMRTRRSFLATTTSSPSPTSRRPIFQLSATRCA